MAIPRVGSGSAGGEWIFAKVELLLQHGVSSMSCVHVLAYLCDGDVEVQVE